MVTSLRVFNAQMHSSIIPDVARPATFKLRLPTQNMANK